MNTQLAFVGRRINMAPRTHRRWLVALIYLISTVLIVAWAWFSRYAAGSLAYDPTTSSLAWAWFSRYAGWFAAGCLIAVVALYLLILHLVGGPSEATDEREKRRWDQVRARAYPWLGYVLLLALGTSQVHRNVNATIHPALHGILQQLPYSILMAAGVLYLTLPQAILLWTEPDMDSGGPPA
jgi:TRAP-type C4-dicarboxylate transport system permease small subunit